MSEEATSSTAKRDRSPGYPFISLRAAIERTTKFEDYFKRHPALATQAGLAWGMKPISSQAAQTLAALKSYGLVDYEGTGDKRNVKLSEDARTYLRAQQDSVKKAVLERCALKPKAIAKYWAIWGADRPPNPICLDKLVLEGGFTESAAQTFLKVYDETIAYAGPGNGGKLPLAEDENDQDQDQEIKVGDFVQWESGGVLKFSEPRRVRAIQDAEWLFVDGSETGIPITEVTMESAAVQTPPPAPPTLPLPLQETKLPGETEWLKGRISKDGSGFRLMGTGEFGPKEIGRLIKLLEAQKKILSGEDEDAE